MKYFPILRPVFVGSIEFTTEAIVNQLSIPTVRDEWGRARDLFILPQLAIMRRKSESVQQVEHSSYMGVYDEVGWEVSPPLNLGYKNARGRGNDPSGPVPGVLPNIFNGPRDSRFISPAGCALENGTWHDSPWIYSGVDANSKMDLIIGRAPEALAINMTQTDQADDERGWLDSKQVQYFPAYSRYALQTMGLGEDSLRSFVSAFPIKCFLPQLLEPLNNGSPSQTQQGFLCELSSPLQKSGDNAFNLALNTFTLLPSRQGTTFRKLQLREKERRTDSLFVTMFETTRIPTNFSLTITCDICYLVRGIC